MKTLDILYEDNLAIIINKPAGLAVQGGKNVKNSLDMILKENYKNDKSTPLLVHRLDKDTSGVIMVAKTKEAAARFSSYFENKKTIKKYLAVCSGIPPKNEGTINISLEIDGKMKKSHTEYKLLKTGAVSGLNFSVLEIELGTGRMHQIRRHLATIGCPILGDDKYGDFKLNKNLKQKKLLLHSARLVIKELYIDVESPLPEYFNKYIILT